MLPAFTTSAALVLVGCGSTGSEPAPTVSVAPAATPTPTPTPSPTKQENARGELIKEIGEVAGMTNSDQTANTLNFKVTSIKPAKCDGPWGVEPNGYPIAVALEIETAADFEGPLVVNGEEGMISFAPDNWTGYAANGTRMNTVNSPITYNCYEDRNKQLPDYIGKAEKLNGVIVLDVASKKGEIAFDPANFGGWVWEYSVK